VPTWQSPHCQFIHKPADILRLDSDNLQCSQCKQAFPAVATGAQAQKRPSRQRKIPILIGLSAKLSGLDHWCGVTCVSGWARFCLLKRNDINAQGQRSILFILLAL